MDDSRVMLSAETSTDFRQRRVRKRLTEIHRNLTGHRDRLRVISRLQFDELQVVVVGDVLLDDLDDDVFFELDTYWLKVAGHDPAQIISKFGKRARYLHIKDGPAEWTESMATDPPPMTAVGKGTQNFPEIIKAADGNTEWLVIEMDKCECDVFTAMKESYTYLITNKLGVGKL
jgi:hypothetical protein